MNRRRAGGSALVAVLAVPSVALTACGGDHGATTRPGPTAAIGFVGALTGDSANLGVNIRDGIRVAVEEENAKGGRQVKLDEFDTAGDAVRASSIKDQFIKDPGVVGIVGPAFSGETRAVLPALQKAGLVMISASAGNKDLPNVVPNSTVFHRVIADDALKASGIVAYLTSLNPRPAKVAYVNDNTDYGKGLAEDVESIATARGLPRAVTAIVDPKAQDFSSTVNAIKQAAPSHVFYGGYSAEAGRLRKQLVEAKVNAEFISGEGSLDGGFITAAGPAAAEGARLSCPCNPALESSTGGLRAFYDSYKARLGKEPGLYSPEAYDAARILIQGIKAGNADRAKLRRYVGRLGLFQGVSKAIEFEAGGNLKARTVFMFQVKSGKIAPLQQVEAS